MNSFYKRLSEVQKKKKTCLCVGLDPRLDRLPEPLKGRSGAVFSFLKDIVDGTEEFVCCFKPQIACFGAYGLEETLLRMIEYIHKTYPEIPVILDAKRNDIGATSEMYAMEIFDRYKADAVTLNPYMGWESVEAFVKHRDKGIFILCRTSNPGAGELQNLKVDGEPLYALVAGKALKTWNPFKNVGLVVGATAVEEVQNLRNRFPGAWFLVPGVGSQGGDMDSVMKYGKSREGGGLIISSSRAVLYAGKGPDYVKKARQVVQKMQKKMKGYFEIEKDGFHES